MIGTDLAEIVWGQHAMPIRSGDDSSLADWISHREDRRPFALSIALPRMRDRTSSQLAAVSDTARRHGLGWADLDAAIRASPIRETGLDELAAWLSKQDARPLDLRRPSQTRYLFFRSSADHPYSIRDGEPPGRSITMIRQVQK